MKELEIIKSTIKQQMQELYKDRLDKVVLFGSYARGEQQKESDIDFMIVLKDEKIQKFKEIVKINDAVYDLSLEYNALISTIPTTQAKYHSEYDPFYKNVRKDAITL